MERVFPKPALFLSAAPASQRFSSLQMESVDRLAEAMKFYPNRPAFAHGLVRLHAAAPDARIRDGNRALALARDLVAREQPNADLAEAMAMAMAETGQFEEAVTGSSARQGRRDA